MVKPKEGEAYIATNAVFEAVRRDDKDNLDFANIEGGPKRTIYRINPDRTLTEIATWTYVEDMSPEGKQILAQVAKNCGGSGDRMAFALFEFYAILGAGTIAGIGVGGAVGSNLVIQGMAGGASAGFASSTTEVALDRTDAAVTGIKYQGSVEGDIEKVGKNTFWGGVVGGGFGGLFKGWQWAKGAFKAKVPNQPIVKEGIYEFPDQTAGGIPYVGQSERVPTRLGEHQAGWSPYAGDRKHDSDPGRQDCQRNRGAQSNSTANGGTEGQKFSFGSKQGRSHWKEAPGVTGVA